MAGKQLTQEQFKELERIFSTGDRTGYYVKYYEYTGSEQSLLQAEISSFSGTIGGVAEAANMILAKHPSYPKAGVIAFSEKIALGHFNAVQSSFESGTPLKEDEIRNLAKSAWREENLDSFFPGNFLVGIDNLIEGNIEAAQSNILSSGTAVGLAGGVLHALTLGVFTGNNLLKIIGKGKNLITNVTPDYMVEYTYDKNLGKTILVQGTGVEQQGKNIYVVEGFSEYEIAKKFNIPIENVIQLSYTNYDPEEKRWSPLKLFSFVPPNPPEVIKKEEPEKELIYKFENKQIEFEGFKNIVFESFSSSLRLTDIVSINNGFLLSIYYTGDDINSEGLYIQTLNKDTLSFSLPLFIINDKFPYTTSKPTEEMTLLTNGNLAYAYGHMNCKYVVFNQKGNIINHNECNGYFSYTQATEDGFLIISYKHVTDSSGKLNEIQHLQYYNNEGDLNGPEYQFGLGNKNWITARFCKFPDNDNIAAVWYGQNNIIYTAILSEKGEFLYNIKPINLNVYDNNIPFLDVECLENGKYAFTSDHVGKVDKSKLILGLVNSKNITDIEIFTITNNFYALHPELSTINDGKLVIIWNEDDLTKNTLGYDILVNIFDSEKGQFNNQPVIFKKEGEQRNNLLTANNNLLLFAEESVIAEEGSDGVIKKYLSALSIHTQELGISGTNHNAILHYEL
jgi:hypothetical protein